LRIYAKNFKLLVEKSRFESEGGLQMKNVSKNDKLYKGITKHSLYEADARDLSFIGTETVHLICTSPPYGSLKIYPDHPGQLGNIASYEKFLDELDAVWAECLRILVPGGRVACVVGDICVSRRQSGRHHVLPLSADFQVRARHLGFDCLTPIRWLKVSNIKLEASKSARYLGKPNLPNGIVKNDIEHILFFRKPGGYRKPTPEMEKRSFIATDDYIRWFAPIWTDVTGQLRRDHPAPYPVEVPRRLIRMFSFSGDIVVDPFAGTGSTTLAALETGRNSISVEIEPRYVDMIAKRVRKSKFTGKIKIHSQSGVETLNETRPKKEASNVYS
jgi:site-specific DNA-methyltransferase (adenine-specific)